MNLVTPKMGLAWGQLKRKNSNLMRVQYRPAEGLIELLFGISGDRGLGLRWLIFGQNNVSQFQEP